jgi:hypothetical protein
MKAFVRFGLPILILASLALEVQAQGVVFTSARVPAVAFVKASRDTIFLKRADSAVRPILYRAGTLDSVRKLAILDVSPDNSKYLISGIFYYKDLSQQPASYMGLLSIPTNLNLDNLAADVVLGHVHLLKAYTLAGGGFRPTGKITEDGKSWIAIMSSSSTAANPPIVFYHGSMDQNEAPGNIDSAVVVTTSPNETSDYHLSNVAITPDGKHAIAVAVNQVSTLQAAGYWFYHWDLSANGKPLIIRGPLQITLNDNAQDSIFGVTVMIDPMDAAVGQVGLMNKQNGSIEFKKWSYSNSGNVSLNDGTLTIPRSSIPSDEYFFAGENRGLYKENGRNNVMPAMAGDMSFSRSADSAVFITHPQDDQNSVDVRNKKTRIYVFTGGSAKAIYNDSSAQELQPIFAYDVAYTKHYPGIAWSGSHAGSFGSHDTMTTTTLQFSIKDTSTFAAVRVDSVLITGTDAAEFKLAPGAVPTTVQPGSTITLSVAWTPVGDKGDRSATMTVYASNGPNGPETIVQNLTGTATVKKPTGGGGVKEDPALAAAIEVQPNPFSASTSIRLTAPDAGTMALIVHDALGRVVFASDARKVQAGSIESFEFDAKSLALPNGVYYVTAFLGDRQASRQVVFVK